MKPHRASAPAPLKSGHRKPVPVWAVAILMSSMLGVASAQPDVPRGAAAKPDFAPAAMHLPNCCFAAALVAADLNGDGRVDLVAGNMMSGDVSLLLSDGSGGYAEPVSLPLLDQPAGDIAVALGDMNGDGRMDLAVAGYDPSEIRVYPGDGAGGFGDPMFFDAGSGSQPTAIALADITGDGHLDIVTANGQSGSVAVLVGDGAGSFAAAVHSAAGAWPSRLVVADFNADGHLDVATTNIDSRDVSVLIGDGSGHFAVPQAISVGAESRPFALAAGDINGDGHPDLVVANAATGGQDFPPPDLPGTVAVLINNGSGAFAPAQLLPAGPGKGRAHGVALADVTGDGNIDIVVTRPNANAVSVLAGDGSGAFAAAVNRPVAVGPGPVVIADVTGDGIGDIVVGNAVSPSISVLPVDGAGGFGFAANFDAGEFSHWVATADFNGDGHPDVATANAMGNDVSVLLGDGLGGFASAVHYATGNSPTMVAVGDVNGDGRPDIVTANLGGDGVSVLLGRGDGSFEAAVDFSAGGIWESPYALALGDANGDGHLDIVTANTNISNESISFFAGDGAGGFAPAVVLPLGASGTLRDPHGIALADINGDGNADIVTANTVSGDLSILLGDGAGGFAAATHLVTGMGPVVVGVKDVTGDGVVDIVTLNTSAQSVSVLVGDGSGGYASAVDYPIYPAQDIQDYMPWPWGMTLADVNGDGALDILTANTQNDTVSVLVNDGAGHFSTYAWFDTGALPGAVAVADIDGDGQPDAITANRENGTVSVLFNRSAVVDMIFANGFEARP